jgi:hypothetical protein
LISNTEARFSKSRFLRQPCPMNKKQTVLKRSSSTTRGATPQRTHDKNSTTFTKEFQPKGKRGRKAGVPNFITREVKEAIIDACNRYGADGSGTGGLEGYMFKLCAEQPGVMGGLLGRIMPTQVTIEKTQRPEPYKSYAPADGLIPAGSCMRADSSGGTRTSAQHRRAW